MMNVRLPIVLLVVVPLARCSAEASDPFDRVRNRIERELIQKQIPSLAVAVAKDGEIIWEQGFGWANRERRVSATEHTPYSLASISKPITATGLMILVERGLVDLDDPANHYLPTDAQIRSPLGQSNAATLRRLANHTSGLPLHYQFFYEDEEYRRPAFEESIRRYGVLVRPPGERYQYANFGYGILDYIIRRKSGLSYADFMRQEVFLPLGMTHTSVHLTPELERQAAVRYAPDQTPLPFYHFDHPGASAVFSSAHDLVRFGMFHLRQMQPDQKAILEQRSITEMHRPTAEAGGSRQYGVGWFVAPDEHGYRTVSHTGGMGGVRTRLTLVPSEGIAVATLCNFNTSFPLEINREILSALLPEYGVSWRKSDDHQVNRQPPTPHCPPTLVGYWAGEVATYQGARRLELWAHAEGLVLVRLGGGLTSVLSNSRLADGQLTGVFASNVGTADANRRPYHLHLRVKLRDAERMNGSLTAISLPGRRAGNALSYWTDLRREDTDPQLRALFNGQNLSGWRVLDRFDFQRHGPVTVEEGEIVLGMGSPATGIALDHGPPRYDYEISLQAKRIEGSDFFCGITFPVDKDYLSLILGGWGGGVTGLSNLDGMSAVENESTGYVDFEQNRWYKIRLRVSRQKVEAWVDKEKIVDVELADRKLSIWWEQEPVRPLGFASWYTKAALKDIRLKRLP